MRSMRRSIAAFISSALLSVAAIAAPLNLEAYQFTVPTVSVLSQDDPVVMTQSDFVAATPYVVDLAVATPVPIKMTTEFAPLGIDNSANAAVMQNGNFEN